MLCEPPQRAARRDHPIIPYWVRVCSKQGDKRAEMLIAHRLARILFAMSGKGEEFDVAKLNVLAEKPTVAKTYYWPMRRPEQQPVTV